MVKVSSSYHCPRVPNFLKKQGWNGVTELCQKGPGNDGAEAWRQEEAPWCVSLAGRKLEIPQCLFFPSLPSAPACWEVPELSFTVHGFIPYPAMNSPHSGTVPKRRSIEMGPPLWPHFTQSPAGWGWNSWSSSR